VNDLTTTGVYVAGFTDPSIKRNPQLYDVLIDGKYQLCLSDRIQNQTGQDKTTKYSDSEPKTLLNEL
jgi:hypothetical protein